MNKDIKFRNKDGSQYPEWKKVSFTDCCNLIHGFQFRKEHFRDSGIPIIKIGSLIDNGGLTFENATYIDENFKEDFENFKLFKGDILMALTGGTLGKVSKIYKDYGLIFQNYRVGKFVPKKNALKDYIYYILQSTLVQNRVKSLVNEAAQPNFGKQDFEKIHFFLPSIKEQQKIANCLSSLDDVINTETEKLDLLQNHKKGLLQQLFPKQGKSQPSYRFPEFKGDGDWMTTSLNNCLDYLQPTKYVVNSTDYNNKYVTPVLTAGKTFVLGYTNEEEGIFDDNLPVIIFDDFTTATKYVDFPFKVKSSAMKILLAKDDNNIKFIFEAIQNLKFEVSTHKRHWISVYSKLKILKPKDLNEQHKIAVCLSSVDELIESQKQKIEGLKAHKKGLLQKLFPKVNEI